MWVGIHCAVRKVTLGSIDKTEETFHTTTLIHDTLYFSKRERA